MKTKYAAPSTVIIRNATGTSEFNCNCGSWLNHWEEFSHIKYPKCSINQCDEHAEHGAHVTRPKAKYEKYKTHLYIIPMCRTHNLMHGKMFRVKIGTIFVWANKSETCER